jgi:hypothetical protein
MAQLVIEIPEAVDDEVVATLASHFGYQPQVLEGGVPGPGPMGVIGGTWVENQEEQTSFVQRKVAEWLKNICVNAAVQAAVETTRKTTTEAKVAAIDLSQPVKLKGK